jgi:hypothetical protein
MLITKETIGGLTILLRLSKETKGEEIEMTRMLRILSKITLLLMNKERRKSLTLKFIVLGTPTDFLI